MSDQTDLLSGFKRLIVSLRHYNVAAVVFSDFDFQAALGCEFTVHPGPGNRAGPGPDNAGKIPAGPAAHIVPEKSAGSGTGAGTDPATPTERGPCVLADPYLPNIDHLTGLHCPGRPGLSGFVVTGTHGRVGATGGPDANEQRERQFGHPVKHPVSPSARFWLC
nr:hypothetical protein [Thioalkalivibrio sp. ALgr3]